MFEVFDSHDAGYRPVRIGPVWQVSYLNYSRDFSAASTLERHRSTDTSFALLEGCAQLLGYDADGSIEATPLKRGKLYLVPAGCWHAIQTNPGCRCLVIENSNTHLCDVERKPRPEETQGLYRRVFRIINASAADFGSGRC